MHLSSNSSYDTSRKDLLLKCNQMSVHQLVIYHTACQAHRIFNTKYPIYHYDQLFIPQTNVAPLRLITRSQRNNSANNIDYKLTLSRGKFFYQSSKTWNSLPAQMKENPNISTFKKSLKRWVIQNVPPFR